MLGKTAAFIIPCLEKVDTTKKQIQSKLVIRFDFYMYYYTLHQYKQCYYEMYYVCTI